MDIINSIHPVFVEMLAKAEAYFEVSKLTTYPYHQCLVLCTTRGEHIVYPVTADSVDQLKSRQCALITEPDHSSVAKIVCMWENKALDVPSHQFMTTLCGINAENKNAEILLNAGKNAYITKKISDII